jgi:D,D-heptose 1,7-bisphosphate phosphatase
MNRAIFLDRDNTLIHADGDVGDPAQVKLIQGAASAIASVRGLGYKVIVVSNQGGVARGQYTEEDVGRVNNRVSELMLATSGSGAAIDRFYYCPFHPDGTVENYRRDHPWRKPQPGMLLQAIKDLSLDPSQCWMIGDDLGDVAAGAAAGVRTILLRADAGEQPPLRQGQAAAQLLGSDVAGTAGAGHTGAGAHPGVPDFVARNLIEAVRVVAQQRRPEGVDESRLAAPSATTATPVAGQRPPAGTPTSPGVAPRPTQTPIPIAAGGGTSGGGGASAKRPAVIEPQTVESKVRVVSAAPGLRPAPAPVASAPGVAPVPASKPTVAAVPAAPITAPPAPPVAAVAAPVAPTAPVVSKPGAPSSGAASVATVTAQVGTPGSAAPEKNPHPIPLPEKGEGVPTPTLEQTVRHILQEMRNNRRVEGDVSVMGVMAIVMLMIAVVCLLGGLLLSGGDTGALLRWMGAAIVAALTANALLLFRR